MDSVLLSDLERYYIIHGAELGCRTDGRKVNEYRPLEIETHILSHASGSASVRIGGTHLIGCVKMEVGKPLAAKPSEGRIEINLEWQHHEWNVDSNKTDSATRNSLSQFEDKLLPIFVTVHKIGNAHVVDACKEEEACSLSRLSTVVYPDGGLGAIVQEGCGSCQLDTLMEMSELARDVGVEMNAALLRTLQLERQLRSSI